MQYGDHSIDTVKDVARLRRRIAESGIPEKLTDRNLVIGTWNIRGFGRVCGSSGEPLPDALVWFNQQGHPVKLTGIGTFGTTVDRHGRIGVSYYQDPGLRAQLNGHQARSIEIRNRRNIGRDDAGYIAPWNADHPDDPVV